MTLIVFLRRRERKTSGLGKEDEEATQTIKVKIKIKARVPELRNLDGQNGQPWSFRGCRFPDQRTANQAL